MTPDQELQYVRAEEADLRKQELTPSYHTVRIPSMPEHQGFYSQQVTLLWICPVCLGPRGEPFETISYDGSRRLAVDGWTNPCGHVDSYTDCRREAKERVAA